MAYSTNAQVETILGLEAGTLTAAQDTMITAMIVLGDGLIDDLTNSKLGGSEAGLATISAAVAAHLYTKGPSEVFNKEFRQQVKDALRNQLTNKDYKRLAYIGDMVTPFETDED